MATLNWVLVHQDDRPELLPDETILHYSSHVSVKIIRSAYRTLSGPGTVYVTNKRLAIVNHNVGAVQLGAPADVFKSVSVAYKYLSVGKLVQPLFSANYYEFWFPGSPEGGLDGMCQMQLKFTEGGIYEFHTAYSSARESSSLDMSEPLPAYEP